MYLLLLHELRVGTIIHDILAKHGRGERAVNLLRIHIFKLAIQNEIVSLGSKADRGLLSEEYEGKNIAVLLSC